MSTATSELVVINTDKKGDKDSDQVKTKIRLMLTEHLEDLNISGTWKFDLFRKTGKGGHADFQYLRAGHSPDCLIFYVRPFSRDSGWNIRLFAPSPELFKSLRQRFEKEPTPPKKEEFEAHSYVDGQLAKATISGHSPHGLNITLDEKFLGFVPLEDFSPSYNRKDLLHYPVGKSIRVCISDASGRVVRCSLRTDGIAATSLSNDLFSGKPERDGSLSLVGFTKTVERQLMALSYVADVAITYHPNGTPYDEVTAYLKEGLLSEYKAKSIDQRAIGALMRALTDDQQGNVDPFVIKKNDLVFVTRHGWNELRGIGKNYDPKWPEEAPVVMTADVEDQVSPGNPQRETKIEEEDQVSPGNPVRGPVEDDGDGFISASNPDYVNKLNEAHNFPTPTPEPILAEPKAEVVDIKFVKEVINNVDNVEIEDVVAYIAACQRLAEIDRQSQALLEEMKRLKVWLEENKKFRVSAMRVFNFLKEESA
jgi:hypothetical protein